MRFRCVWCATDDVPGSEGADDDLDRMLRDDAAGDDNGLCDDCWCELNDALLGLVAALVGWLP